MAIPLKIVDTDTYAYKYHDSDMPSKKVLLIAIDNNTRTLVIAIIK